MHKLDAWSRNLNTKFTLLLRDCFFGATKSTMNILILINMDILLRDCFLGAIKLTKNVDSDKYVYSSSGIGFDAHSKFL